MSNLKRVIHEQIAITIPGAAGYCRIDGDFKTENNETMCQITFSKFQMGTLIPMPEQFMRDLENVLLAYIAREKDERKHQ